VQTQDLTVFNVTKEAVVARQAQVIDQLPPIAGEQRVAYTPVTPQPPDWWADALIPLDDVEAPTAALTIFHGASTRRVLRPYDSNRCC
jgi:hypothetical protein